MKYIPYRSKLIILGIYCVATLFICLNYLSSVTSSITSLFDARRLVFHSDYCILPYAFDGTKRTTVVDDYGRRAVTLVLHISADYVREETLLEQISNWSGPVSLAIYFDQPTTQLPCIEYMLDRLHRQHAASMTRLAVHYYTLSNQCYTLIDHSTWENCYQRNGTKTYEEIAAYPANVGRNIAREFVRTDYILIADYEHLFSRGFERRMTEIAEREKISETKTLLVYRIFEVAHDVEGPKTKSDLDRLLKKKKAVTFHERFYKKGHSIPGLDKWLSKPEREGDGIAERNLDMKSRSSWEPQFVSSNTIPFHDESFPYMIRDNTCLRWEVCRAGYHLHLVEDLFMFHRGIKTAGDIRKTKQVQSVNRERFNIALKAFRERMNSTYPDTEQSCPTFKF